MVHCEYCYFPSSGITQCTVCGSESFLTDDCLRVTIVAAAEDLGAVAGPIELLRLVLGDEMFLSSDSRNAGLIEIRQLPGHKPGKLGLAVRLVDVSEEVPAADCFAIGFSNATAILLPMDLNPRFDDVLTFTRLPEVQRMMKSHIVWTALVSNRNQVVPSLEEHSWLWGVDRNREDWDRRRAACRDWFAASFGASFGWFSDEISPYHAEFAILRAQDGSPTPRGNDAVFIEAILRAAYGGSETTSLIEFAATGDRLGSLRGFVAY